MFRQGDFEFFEKIFSQAGVSAKLGEPVDDRPLRRHVSFAFRDVAADHLDLVSSIHPIA